MRIRLSRRPSSVHGSGVLITSSKRGRRISPVDRAMGTIKRAVAQGNTIASAVNGINSRGAPALLGAAPRDLPFRDMAAVFECYWDEASYMKENAMPVASGLYVKPSGGARASPSGPRNCTGWHASMGPTLSVTTVSVT